MKHYQVKVGQTYLAATGDWLFEVTGVVSHDVGWAVQYTVLQTGQHCQCPPCEFAARVVRPLQLAPRTFPQRSQ
jgi:hypothetical protein